MKLRWLSLGDSLTRLLEIWSSLKAYMIYVIENKLQESPNIKEIKNIDYKHFSYLFSSETFHLKIIFLEYIVQGLNRYNRAFQDQTFSINNALTEITTCYLFIKNLIIKPCKLSMKEMIKMNWKDSNQKVYFYSPEDFSTLISKSVPKMQKLSELSAKEQEFFLTFQDFSSSILTSLPKYLPFEDEVLESAKFVNLDLILILKIELEGFQLISTF